MKRINFILLGVIVLGTLNVIAQDQDQIKRMMPNPVPASPNVASLGKFGDYQVSHFSGLPEISIPIFEVKSGGLSIPITLSYHASGVKPTDIASWVGMGWSLSAGGQISRNVQGKPDDEYYYGHALNESPSNCLTYQYLKESATGVSDTEPDIFSYSFAGRSGKFILPPNGFNTHASPYLIPYAPLNVKRISDIQYEITDESGVLYRYGTNSSGQIYTESTHATNGGNPTLNATTAWYITDMIAPNSNDNISFAYQDVGTANTHDISHVYTIIDKCQVSNGGGCPASSTIPQSLNVDSYVNQQGLSRIDFETGRVEFTMGATRNDFGQDLRSLSAITIYSKVNGNYILQKTIRFVYSYFTSSTGDNDALKLDEVQFLGGATTPVQSYKFSYFTDSFSWSRSSSNYLNARDLWGYYNGATQNTDLILSKTISYTANANEQLTFGGAQNRSVNTQYIKEGVLSRIDFPTGGYTEFDYESNKYLDETNATPVPTLAGGLRVTRITSSDGETAAPLVKTYKYGNAQSGYGKPNFSSFQFNYMSAQLYYSDCVVTGPSSSYQVRTFFSNSAFSQDSFDASPVRYSYVTEYLGDPAIRINGRTEYIFDNGVSPGDVDLVVPTSGKYYRSSYSWKRGKLTKKTVYDAGSHIVSSSTIHYDLFQEVNTQIGYGVTQFYTGNNSTCSGTSCINESGDHINPNTFFFRSYYQNSGVLAETSTTEDTYETGATQRFFTTETNRTIHASKIQPLEIAVSRSNSTDEVVTVNTYPFQLSAGSSSTGAAQGIYLLNTKNIISNPIETFTYLQNTDGSNQRVISAQVTSYKQNAANSNQVVPDQIYLFESSAPIPKSLYTQVTVNGTNNGLSMNSHFKLRIRLSSYDSDGNLLSANKVNDVTDSYLYGYNNAFPIAAVKNALPTELLYQNFEELPVSATIISSGQARSGTQYYLGDYTVSFIAPNVRSYLLEYWYLDAQNKWQFVTKPYTGNSMVLTEGLAIDDVRIYPKDAELSTYTYNPVFGITSTTDTNGTGTYYEYDNFGRLQLARDADKNIVKTYEYQYKKVQK